MLGDWSVSTIALSEVLAALFAGATALILANRGFGALALEFQILVSYLTVAVVLASCAIVPIARGKRAGPTKSGDAVSGWGFAGFAAVNYWSRNIDNLLVGRFLGAAQLGLYERAYTLMYVPATQVTAALGA